MTTAGQHELTIVERRPRRYLRVRDCMADLSCSKSHVLALIRKGRVDSKKLDGLLLIDAASWDAYLDGDDDEGDPS